MKIQYPWLWRGGFVILAGGSLARALGAPPVVILVSGLGLILVVLSLYRKPGDGDAPPRL
jgi:hypothetical protein